MAYRGAAEMPFAFRHFVVTPSDSVDFEEVVRVIYANADGNIAVVDQNGVAVTYAMKAGMQVAVAARRVNATGTTCASVIAWP